MPSRVSAALVAFSACTPPPPPPTPPASLRIAEPRRIADAPGAHALRRRADGRAVAYLTGETAGPRALHLAATDGSGAVKIADGVLAEGQGPDTIVALRLAGAGDTVAWQDAAGALWAARPGGAAKKLADLLARDFRFAVARDGRRVLVLADTGWVLHDLDGEPAVTALGEDGGATAWSLGARGERVAVVRVFTGVREALVVDLASGFIQTYTCALCDVSLSAISEDGSRVAFAVAGGGVWAAAEGAAPVKIMDEPAERLALTPDGARVLAVDDLGRLRVAPADATAPAAIAAVNAGLIGPVGATAAVYAQPLGEGFVAPLFVLPIGGSGAVKLGDHGSPVGAIFSPATDPALAAVAASVDLRSGGVPDDEGLGALVVAQAPDWLPVSMGQNVRLGDAEWSPEGARVLYVAAGDLWMGHASAGAKLKLLPQVPAYSYTWVLGGAAAAAISEGGMVARGLDGAVWRFDEGATEFLSLSGGQGPVCYAIPTGERAGLWVGGPTPP